MLAKPKDGDLKVWWIPQVAMKAFEVPVNTVAEAKLLLKTLADYDIFQFENKVKPDYCNTGGLVIFDAKENEWIDWENEDGDSIDDLM
jgi:hypothetical protein